METVKKIVVQGIKGGVGNTTVVANMAVALVNLGYRVICIDACKSNDLKLHFGMGVEHSSGLFKALSANESWQSTSMKDETDVVVFPFGEVEESSYKSFENFEVLDHMLIDIDFEDIPTVILVDFPHYLDLDIHRPFSQLDGVIFTSSPEISCITKIKQKYTEDDDNMLVFNRFSPQQELQSELQILLSAGLRSELFLGGILLDEYIHEALAQNTCAVHLNRYRKCSKDFNQLALKLVASIFDTEVMHQALLHLAEKMSE